MSAKTIYKKFCAPLEVLLFVLFSSANTNAAPGDLDSSFGSGGRVTTNFNFAHARGVAIQADGKIVTVGTDEGGSRAQFVLVRYNPDGSLDTTFGSGGKVASSIEQFNYAYSMAIQRDGSIVVAGYAGVFGPIRDFAVVRYTATGALDTSFDGDGKVIIDMGGDNFANDLAIQPDGKIVIAGGSGVAESRNYAFAIARLNADGTLDTSFDGDGRKITSLGAYSDFGAAAVVIQPDGKIIAAGSRGDGPGFSPTDFALVRYNADGGLDASFDGDGIVITNAAPNDAFTDVALQTDGRIVAVGGNRVVRYEASGLLDASFDGDGIAAAPLGIRSVVIQSNGKVVAGGSTGEHALVRFNGNGSLDSSFSSDGMVTTAFDNLDYSLGYGGINSLAIQLDGKIVSAGFWGLDGKFSHFAIARYIGDSAVARPTKFDFDGDDKADTSVFRPSNGFWWVNRSGLDVSGTQFGISTDKIVPADYDGDSKTDIAVYRDGIWLWINSSNNVMRQAVWGIPGDTPQPADYTGDGRAELAVYRDGTWFTYDIPTGLASSVPFGLPTDRPVAADYDGDERTDFAVYRDGVWYLSRSTQGFAALQFGIASDQPVAADYDGDGKTDLAVFREGIWYVQRSQLGFTAFHFGGAADTPVPADYDGNGSAEAAVFRNGVWYLRQDTGAFSAIAFGLVTDQPVPAAYLP